MRLVPVLLAACATDPAPELEPSEHLDVLAFERAVAWPDPSVVTVASLVTLLTASDLDQEGLRYFGERVAASDGRPAHPWFQAAHAVFVARTAGDVPLLRRVAAVEGAIAELDAAVAADPGFPRYLRGATFAALPARFDVADRAIGDLEWILDHRDLYPAGLDRGALRYLAEAYTTAGRPADAAPRGPRRAGPRDAVRGRRRRGVPVRVAQDRRGRRPGVGRVGLRLRRHRVRRDDGRPGGDRRRHRPRTRRRRARCRPGVHHRAAHPPGADPRPLGPRRWCRWPR